VNLDRLLGATSAVRREAIRRDAGERHDPRFDVPIAMLLDLADDLSDHGLVSADVDVFVEDLHAVHWLDAELDPDGYERARIYGGSFPLSWLAPDEHVQSAGDGTGACEIVAADASVRRVEIGDVVPERRRR
jgi:hypothetical protein